MSAPNDSINTGTTASSVASKNSGIGGTMKYPSDIDSAPYFVGFHFVKYERYIMSGVKYSPIGNVFLPLPNNVSEEFGISYNNGDQGIFGAKGGLSQLKQSGVDLAGQISKRVEADGNKILSQDKGSVTAAGRDLAAKLGLLATVGLPEFMKDTAVGRAGAQVLGFVANPHMTPIFEGVELRKHHFDWMFSPRSQSESNKLEEVVNAFRQFAHPRFEPQTNNFGLQFPYQVFCNFYNTNFLYPVKRSVITNISIDNGASGNMAFYRGGAPVAIKFSIALQETEILTAEDFEHDTMEKTRYTGDYSTDVGRADQGAAVSPPRAGGPR